MNLVLAESELPVRLRFDPALTDDQLLEFCAANDIASIERDPNGEILVMSPAGFGSSNRNVRIIRLLDEWAEADGRGVTTGPDGGYVLPDGSMRAPDAAWTSRQRMEKAGQTNTEDFSAVCPEFVIELRSKSDRLPALETKMETWIGNGAELAWLIDPERRAVTIYRPGDAPESLQNPGSVQGTGRWRGSNWSWPGSGNNSSAPSTLSRFTRWMGSRHYFLSDFMSITNRYLTSALTTRAYASSS